MTTPAKLNLPPSVAKGVPKLEEKECVAESA